MGGSYAFANPERQDLDFEQAAKPSGSVVGFSTVVIDEYLVIATVAEEGATQLSNAGRRLHPA